jgi:hypothetical protein
MLIAVFPDLLYIGSHDRLRSLERCRSGRTGLTRNQVCSLLYREFESPSLRNVPIYGRKKNDRRKPVVFFISHRDHSAGVLRR